MLKSALALLFACAVWPAEAAGHVVINEIMYHPPRDRDAMQFLELLNPTAGAVDLSGWRLAGAVKFTFPAKTLLPPGGFLVVARDKATFDRTHSDATPALGPFAGKLSHKGEKLELLDASGHVVERVSFQDKAPWPLGADGYGSSLERICAEGGADDPQNWAASHTPAGTLAGGSPGEANSVTSAKPLPVVRDVRWNVVVKPGETMEVTAQISGAAAIDRVLLAYRTIHSGRQSASAEVKMTAEGKAGQYAAQIPAQAAGTLVRFTIRATDKNNAVRIEPGEAEPRPSFSALVSDPIERGKIPQLTVINPEPLKGGAGNKFAAARRDVKGPGKSAVLHVPPEGEIQLFDFVQVRRRAGGLKLHFSRDRPLAEMTTVNVIYEGPSRWVLAEHLSYELYRRAGMNIEKSGHLRLTVDGRALGYYLFVEQPNKNFLARSGREDSGNLYKVLWFGQDIVDQHEKKTNPGTGHADIVSLIETLRKKSGAAQWAYINEQFNVEAFVNYYAVNMCIENWDGFFNNHFVYHDAKPGGKWDILPWDEDKTWGEYDGGPSDYSWYDMPLTAGSGSPRAPRSNGWFGGGGGFNGWWRPPGLLSGPLLSNPQFRQKFENRLRELCTTAFTPEKFGPLVQALQAQLRGEVELKARLTRQDPAAALRQFDANINSFQRQLVNRPKYILANLK